MLPPFAILPFFELIVVKTWCRALIQLLNRFVCQFTTSVNAFLRMSSHVIRPSDRFRVRFLTAKQLFSCPGKDLRFEHLSVLVKHTFVRFSCALSASEVHKIKERCWFSQINVFHPFLPHRIKVLLLSSECNVIHVYQEK